jgi:hypothetical protein
MGKYLGAILSIVVAAGIVVGVIIGIGYFSHDPRVMAATPANGYVNSYKHVTIKLATFPFSPYQDSDWISAHGNDYGQAPPPGDNQDWVTYWPTTNFTVPAHALVTMTIENWDSATPLLNPYYAIPHGVYDDSAEPTNTVNVDGKPITSADPGNVSHTFTIHSVVQGNQPWLFVSVPLTAVPNNAKADSAGMPLKPVVTQFSFVTPDQPGDYIWQCFDPCGSGFNGFGGPMSTKGYMSGMLTVVS